MNEIRFNKNVFGKSFDIFLFVVLLEQKWLKESLGGSIMSYSNHRLSGHRQNLHAGCEWVGRICAEVRLERVVQLAENLRRMFLRDRVSHVETCDSFVQVTTKKRVSIRKPSKPFASLLELTCSWYPCICSCQPLTAGSRKAARIARAGTD